MASGNAQGVARLYESETLDEIVQWWNERKEAGLPEQRPVIRGGTGQRQNTGMCVDAVVLKRAREKARHERIRTGGSMSQLVELLLWQYIGSPADLLARE